MRVYIKKIKVLIFLQGIMAILLFGCKKFLDEKPNKSITTVRNIADLQSILDYNIGTYSSLLSAGTDEYYLTDESWASKSLQDRDAYIWESSTSYLNDWTLAYAQVFTANTVLNELSLLRSNDLKGSEYIKGQALALRSFAFFQLSQLYCPPYSDSSKQLPGLALRLVPDVEVTYPRASVEETYNRMITDLKEAIVLLPNELGANNRATRISVNGLLAKLYLSMRDYKSAGFYANEYLKALNTLTDFNSLDEFADPPIISLNPEIAYMAKCEGAIPLDDALIDTALVNSYDSNDLRKKLFFIDNGDGTYRFKGGYHGELGFAPFCGISTPEMLLISAESYAREGLIANAMDNLNYLLLRRWKAGTFIPRTSATKAEALNLILSERRKELMYKSTRWSDLRRLNLEGYGIELKRTVQGKVYNLLPNDNRWTWLIPNEIMASNRDWKQNKR
uniref:RagB/SusD family nutrient uptake outer membrane protein n=1 Tax=Pedobacter schmidteae TaxID=2201271 RepID=UPI000EB553D6|nr:RagB/SusD family nutrient uptake outer membrane protein [Pedobacter schmidteae]